MFCYSFRTGYSCRFNCPGRLKLYFVLEVDYVINAVAHVDRHQTVTKGKCTTEVFVCLKIFLPQLNAGFMLKVKQESKIYFLHPRKFSGVIKSDS